MPGVRAPITVVIPTSGAGDFGDELIEDLRDQSTQAEAVHVVVNNRRSDVAERGWHSDPDVRVTFLDRDHYYAKGVNIALDDVLTEYVAVINDDVRLSGTWVEAITEGFSRYPDYGSLASRVTSLRDPAVLDSCGDSLHLCGRATANGWLESTDHWTAPQEVFSASGCVAAYRTADLRLAGPLDERFVAYMEDVDLGFRLQLLGRPCLFWPGAEAAHVGGGTRKKARFAARLAERNAVLTVLKNFPGPLLRDVGAEVLTAHLQPCAFEGERSWATWRAGKLSAARHLAHALGERQRVQRARRVSVAYIRSILKEGRPRRCHL